MSNEEETKTTTRKPVEIKPDPDLEGHIEKINIMAIVIIMFIGMILGILLNLW